MKHNIPAAIIGMACFFPKSSGLKEYWRLLFHGEDAITDIPGTHWSPEDYFDDDPKKPDHVYCKRGGFLSQVSFDPSEFGIPPSSLEATDTSQLLGLLAAKMALEDAGYGDGREFDRDKASVILGATGTQELVIPLGARLGHPLWRRAITDSGISPEKTEEIVRRISDSYVSWQENSFPGLLGNVIAGRICNRLDLGGTNCAVDAACASSMSAIHLALMELAAGRSDMAITGGVDALNDIFMHMCFSKTQILSPTGDARPFSKDADGTVLGEGIGMLVLKRLEDAERDEDRIYAVIRAMGTSSDGKSQSIYAPRSEGQAKALCMAYESAGIKPDTVEIIEAHGTGTKVGDATEFQTLERVFRGQEAGDREIGTEDGEQETGDHLLKQCALGSVKSMIGHSKAAAGVAGLIKTVLAIYHKIFLPTLKADEPDPNLNIEESPFYLSTETRPWFSRKEHPRRAGVSAFGFGGSNFHLLLEEHRKEKQEISWDGSVLINEKSVEKSEKPGKIAFIFPGQGSQYVNMARDLICSFPEAFEVMEKANEYARNAELTFSRLTDFIFPYPARNKPKKTLQEEALRSTDVAQPAIGAVSLAMLKILERFGVKPDAACGHSFGELPALYAAGWIDMDTLFRLSFARGSLMASAAGRKGGTMLAVKAKLDAIDDLIREENLDVILANRNSPNQGVLSGTVEAITQAEALCKQRKFRAIKLPVSAAFHSALVKDAQEPFMQLLKEKADIVPTDVSVFANTTGKAYPADAEEAKKLLGEQILCPVNFVSEIENMFDAGIRTFLEIGPKSVLTSLVKTILKGRDFKAISVDSSAGKKFGVEDLSKTLTFLAASGYPVELDKWDQPEKPKKQRMSILISGANYRSEPKPGKPGKPDSGNSNNSDGSGPAGPGPSDNAGTSEQEPGKSAAACHPPAKCCHRPAHPKALSTDNGQRATGNGQKTDKTMYRKDQRQFLNPDPGRLPNRVQGGGAVTDALKAVQEGLKSMQTLHSQTAETHKKFLETQTEAGRTLQMMMDSTRRLAEVSMGVRPPEPAPGLAMENERNYHFQAQEDTPIRESIPRSVASPADASYTPPMLPQIHETPKVVSPETQAPAYKPPSEETPKNNEAVKNTLLETVSDLTGYPTEMLNLEMDIEADLGIDSIKRVEILSTLEEKMPGIPPVSPEIMGTLRTLAQIAEFLSENSGHESQDTGIQSPAPCTASSSPGADRKKLDDMMMAVVSDLTGYPVEMLNPDMDIEADLGIDSIKRVEILSTLEEKMPGLPPVSPEIMGTLRTLGQIAEYLAGSSGTDSPESDARISCAPCISGRNQKEIEDTMMAVVSDLTGYPSEMLNLEMDIEADLGIDSIKRVEILSTLEEKMPGLPSVSPEVMGTLRTLGQIAEYLVGTPENESRNDCDESSESVTPTESPDKVERRIISVVEKKIEPGDSVSIPAGRKVLITDDGTGLARAVADELALHHIEGLAVSPDALKNGQELPHAGGLVILANPGADEAFLKNAFLMTRRVSPAIFDSVRNGGAVFATLTRLDGAFGFKGTGVENPLQGGLAGLAKTVSVEWENVCCHAIDIAPDWRENKAVAKAVVSELLTHGPVEVALEPGNRFVFDLESSPYPRGDINLGSGDVIVITGGARGVTASAAYALAKEISQLNLVLIGRSPHPTAEPEWLVSLEDEGAVKKAILDNEFSGNHVSPVQLEKAYRKHMANREIAKNLEQLKSTGAAVHYYSADVRDSDSVNSVLKDSRSQYGSVNAIIHGAGTLEDRLIIDKTPEQFEKVFDTKVMGLKTLLEATKQDDLRYIVLFSSVSARMGNKGQADYAMANEVLNKIAQQESVTRPDCRVISINWGPWDGGMVSPALKREFKKNGIGLIPTDTGAECMLREMGGDKSCPPEVVIGAALTPENHKLQAATDPQSSTDKLSLTVKREIDVDRYPVLGSHVLDGKPVVPFALIAEWLGHGALHENPGLLLHGLDDIRLLSGIKLDDEKKLIRLLAGKARKKGSVFEVSVEIRDGVKDGREVIHSRAKAILTDTLSHPPSFSTSKDLGIGTYSRSIDEIYEKILFHGLELRGIREIIGYSSHGMMAKVSSAPSPEKWMADPLRSCWIADPLVLDSAFQMAIIWCFEEMGVVSLPSYSASYRQYRNRFPSDGVTAVLEVREATDHKMRGDFTFLDSDDAVIACLTGYEAVMDASLFKAFKS
ncbi:SDR family NAD(P)-dependent oxidoreductase [Desulfococcaceae bacterium HSG8]|nr:SDR family NAD(P)-dependent oxidoreductase [Desulfococcaceae bacterium HSG8]